MTDLSISLLRTFLVTAKTLNITAAATQLHKAPSTISMQLSKLEDILNTEFLVRSQHGIKLTHAGVELREEAALVIAQHDKLVGRFKHQHIDGPVKFGTHDQYATRALKPVFESFVHSYPEAYLDVTCDHSPDTLLKLVEAGKLDIALVEVPINSCSLGESLINDELVWARAENFQLDTEKAIPLVFFPEGCFHRAYAKLALEHASIPHRITFNSQSRAGILTAVFAGIGISAFAKSTLESGLVVIDNALPKLTKTEVRLVVSGKASSATQRLAEAIKENAFFGGS